jgi:hypothetical protein
MSLRTHRTLPLQSTHKNNTGLSGPFQCYRCQNFVHKSQLCNLTPKRVKWGRNNFFSECQKPKQEPLKCWNCHKRHPSNFSVWTRAKYIQGSQLASAKRSNVNKHSATCLTVNNFSNLPQISSRFSWHNPRKLNPSISHHKKIDQSRQHHPRTNHRNEGNSLSELINEMTFVFQGCSIRHFLHKLAKPSNDYDRPNLTELRGLGPQANYTNRATGAYRPS